MPRKKTEPETLDTARVLMPEAVLESKPCSFTELLNEAKASTAVEVLTVEPCQSVAIETRGKRAFLVVEASDEQAAG